MVPGSARPSQSPSASAAAFERLRDRAIESRNFATMVLSSTLPADMSGRHQDIVLTLAEIEIAEKILSKAVKKFNDETGEDVEYYSFSQYESKFKQSNDGSVWASIEESSRLVVMWSEQAILVMRSLGGHDRNESRIINNYGAMTLGDNSDISNAFNTNQFKSFEEIDLKILCTELARLRGELRTLPSSANVDISVGQVALAEQAAHDGKRGEVLEHLKRVGSWTLGVATKIGEGVAAAAIRSALGLP